MTKLKQGLTPRTINDIQQSSRKLAGYISHNTLSYSLLNTHCPYCAQWSGLQAEVLHQSWDKVGL